MLKRIEACLDQRWLTNDGPLVREFEAAIQKVTGAKHAIAVCNATIGLALAAKALGLEGEVIMPSFTFIATAHALAWQGITPVFADIDTSTHNLDPSSVAELITERTTGIVGVHLWGRPCDTAALSELATRKGLKLMYDASHAFGSSTGRGRVGCFGECEVFSFHATKFINSLEGGAVVTNNDALAEKLRLMRNFGFAGFDRVISLGLNAKMNEVSAAVGITNLEAMPEIVAANYRNYTLYRDRIRAIQGISVLEYSAEHANNYQYMVAEIDSLHPEATRDALISALHTNNVIARKYFWPGCHRMEPYRSRQAPPCAALLNTEIVANRIIVLPTGQATTPQELATVCDIIQCELQKVRQ